MNTVSQVREGAVEKSKPNDVDPKRAVVWYKSHSILSFINTNFISTPSIKFNQMTFFSIVNQKALPLYKLVGVERVLLQLLLELMR